MKHRLLHLIILCLAFLASEPLSHASQAVAIAEIVHAGNVALQKGDYKTSLTIFEHIRNLQDEGVEHPKICIGLQLGGDACLSLYRYSEGIDFCKRAITEGEKVGNQQVVLASLNNIGYMYGMFKNYRQAIPYFERALQLAQTVKDENTLSTGLVNLVQCYARLGNIAKAEAYYAQQLRHPLQNKKVDAYARLFDKAELQRAHGTYGVAISTLRQAVDTVTAYRLMDDLMLETLLALGDNFARNHQQDSAIVYLNRAEVLAEQIGDLITQQDASKQLYELYKARNETFKANRMLSRYLSVTDSLARSNEYDKASSSIQEYEEQKNGHRIKMLTLTIHKQTAALVIIGIVLAIVGLILFIIFRYNRRLKQAYELLVAKNEELIAKGISAPSTALSDETLRPLLEQIDQVMHDITIIGNPDFNIAELAHRVDSNQKYISKAINDTYHKNFKAYLNEFRVQEACQRMVDEEHYGNLTIAAIAETVGFKSPNSLILAFRKNLGMTPSVYKQLAIKNKEQQSAD